MNHGCAWSSSISSGTKTLNDDMAGHQDAHHRFSFGVCGAFCACCHELGLVWEDSQGIEEDFVKEAVTEDIIALISSP